MSLKYTEKQINIKAQLYQKVQSVCKDLLKTHPLANSAREYLSKRISSENQDLFDLGYFPDDDNIEVLLERIPKKVLNTLNLIYPYHVQNGDHRVYIDKGILNNHNITMPYRDVYGNIKALVGRTILPEVDRKKQKVSKYKYTIFNKSLHLFGLYQAKSAILRQNSVVLVEGQFDCISCHQYDIHNVVAIGGSSLTKRQFQLLSRFTDNMHLLLDNDLEGQKAAKKISNKYANMGINFNQLKIPEPHKDIDQYLRSGSSNLKIFNQQSN